MRETKIRWAGASWNPMTGCTKVSPGCDHCYAETLALRFGPTSPAFPNGFDPTFKPHKLDDPAKWSPRRIFVNSMSDVHHVDFTTEQIDAVYDRMARWPQHDYLVLTKRPARMRNYLHGGSLVNLNRRPGWLERSNLQQVPPQIWLGSSIESDEFVGRADQLRAIDVPVRFLSLEPLLGPLPSLDLTGISWVIVGGESGPGWRPMDHGWAREIRDRCLDAGVAFYFKQSAAWRTEMGQELDGQRWEQYPLPHPALLKPRQVGVYTDV